MFLKVLRYLIGKIIVFLNPAYFRQFISLECLLGCAINTDRITESQNIRGWMGPLPVI